MALAWMATSAAGPGHLHRAVGQPFLPTPTCQRPSTATFAFLFARTHTLR